MKKQSQAQTAAMQIPSELVAKAKAGDSAAFSELYSLTSANLYRCIRAMIRDEELTWDVQQDTYLRAFRSLNTLEDNDAFFPWLRRIAVNVVAAQMNKRLPLSFSELGDEDDFIPELPDPCIDNQPELSLDRQETSRLVQEILATLPEEQHLILGMRYYDELSVKEIAALLNIAPGTVSAQLHHGRKKVEAAVRALEKQGVKLYGLSPIAFLMALLRSMEPASAAKQEAMKAVIAKAAGSAADAIPVIQAQAVSHGLFGKIVVGVLSVAVAGGAIWGGLKLLDRNSPDTPYRPTETTALYVSDPEHTTDPSAERTTEETAAPTEETAAPTEETAAPTETTVAPTEPEPSTDVVTVELDSVLARVAEDDQARAELQLAYPDAIIPYFFGGVTEVDEIKPDGSRYLVKLVHAVTVTATEEEIAQARQTGTLVLQGKAYRFTDNAAQAGEWAERGALEGEGWIMAEDGSTVYTIARIGSQYFFSGILGSVDQWIEEITDTAWVWMDGDMPVWSVIGSTLDEFTQNKNFLGGQSTTLILDEDGKPVIYYSRA